MCLFFKHFFKLLNLKDKKKVIGKLLKKLGISPQSPNPEMESPEINSELPLAPQNA